MQMTTTFSRALIKIQTTTTFSASFLRAVEIELGSGSMADDKEG
jgi:hypothetical protein